MQEHELTVTHIQSYTVCVCSGVFSLTHQLASQIELRPLNYWWHHCCGSVPVTQQVFSSDAGMMASLLCSHFRRLPLPCCDWDIHPLTHSMIISEIVHTKTHSVIIYSHTRPVTNLHDFSPSAEHRRGYFPERLSVFGHAMNVRSKWCHNSRFWVNCLFNIDYVYNIIWQILDANVGSRELILCLLDLIFNVFFML